MIFCYVLNHQVISLVVTLCAPAISTDYCSFSNLLLLKIHPDGNPRVSTQSLQFLTALTLHPEGSSRLPFQSNIFSLPMLLTFHPEGSYCSSFHSSLFNFLTIHPPGRVSSYDSLQLILEAPSRRKLSLFLPSARNLP